MPTAELRSLSLADIMPPSAYHQPNPRRNVLLLESRVRHGVLSAHTTLPQDYVSIAARVYDNDHPRHRRRRRVACNHVRLDFVFPDTWLARDAVLFATPVVRRQYPSSPSWLQARRQPGTVAHARSEENASAWRNNGEPELSSPPNKWCGHTGSCLCQSLRSRLRLRPPTLLVDPAPIPQLATAPPADAVTFSEAPFIGTDADYPTAATAAHGSPNPGFLRPDWPGHNPAPWASWAPVPPPAHVAVAEVVQPQIEGRAPAPSSRSVPRALAPNDTPNAPCTLAPDATGTAHPSSAPCGSILRLRGGTGTAPRLPSAADPLASGVTRLLARPSLAATYARAEAVQREPIVLSPMTSDTASQELASLLSCVLDAPATYEDAAGSNVIDRVAAAVVDAEGGATNSPSRATSPTGDARAVLNIDGEGNGNGTPRTNGIGAGVDDHMRRHATASLQRVIDRDADARVDKRTSDAAASAGDQPPAPAPLLDSPRQAKVNQRAPAQRIAPTRAFPLPDTSARDHGLPPPMASVSFALTSLSSGATSLPPPCSVQRIVLSSLFVSAKERYLASRVRSYEGVQSTTSSWGLPGDGSAAIEWFAGVGTLAHAYAHRCARVAVLCEQSSAKQRINAALHPDAALTLDADSPFPVPDEPIIHFSAGLPCQPVAPSGACRAEHDHRAPLVTDSVPNAILQLQEEGKLIFLDIEEHADFVTTGSVMLESLRANLMSLPTPIFLSDPEFFNPATVSGPITRRRCAIRGEPLHVIDRIGSVPPLQPMRVKKRIRDIALPAADVRDDQYVEGTLTIIHHTVSPFAPTIVGSLLCGGEHRPVVVGSRVRIDDDIITHVVMSFDGNDHVTLFHDDRKEPWFLRHVAVARITSHMTHSYPVLSMDGFAASCTRVGVPPLGSAKQLWLRDGRAYRPDWRELARLMEIEPVMFNPLHDDESLAENDSIDAIVGDMLSMRMADAMADRSITRSLQYATANNLDDWVASTGDDTTETRAAAHFRPIAYMHNLDIAVALIDVLDGALRVLVSADLLQLPVVEHTCESTSRDSVVKIAEQFVGSEICDSGDRRLHGFLVYSTSALTVVAFPLGDARSPSVDTSFSSWASLRDVAMSPLYVPLAPALARIASHCQGGLPTAHAIPVSDGARPSTPIVSLPYSPNTSPSAWPDQLRLLEMYDAQLRRALDAVPSTHPHKMYLTTWIDQVDTAPNADIPFNLRGVSPAVFDDPILVDTPFAAPMPTPSLPPPSFPAAQITSYRPTSLYHILKPGSITKLARALDTIAESLTFMRNGIELPVRLRRTLTTTVIGQDGFVPEARGIVWDLRSKPDGYFRPLDFAAPIPTHLNTDAYFDAIGDDYPDQSLRHQVRRGALFFADVDLQIVICPHLLSLADGFKNVDRELRRLHALGYVEFNEHEEHAFASQRIRSSRASDSDKVIVALGVIPCRCTPQGTRARKLEPDRPRRISDCGAPRKAVFDSASRPVVPLNDAIGFKTALPSGEQKFPTEHKPRLLHAMQDCAVLQSAARVWREPLLQFNDDTKDCFNQFYLHPSQIWMTSVLWLKLTWVASSCPYTHVLEHVFGYGIGCASGFAQRFGNSLMHLVAQRMDALDAPFLAADAANDPSRAAWLRRRQALAARTGRNEARLYALHIYTDDPEFMCVGYDRFIRLLSCWRDVTSMIGLRMAIAEKRQAGSSILWQGLRLHGTYGAAVIPPAKRKRAVKDLSSIALGNPLRLDEAQSIAGLLEHLLPWAGELRSAMYHFYYPHRAFAALGPQHQFLPTDAMRVQSKRWITRLNERPGISVLAHVIPTHTPKACGSVLVMSSDAAKTGTPTPGIGGYMHGTAWHLPLEPSDVVGPYEIPINVLEFIGVFGNFSAFAPDVPECSSVLALTDSLTSALVVSRHSARAPLMQLVHMRLLSLPQFERIAARTQMAHVYGPANAIADAISRGYFDTLSEIMAQLRVALTWIAPTAATIKLLADVRSAVRSFTDPVFRSLSDTASLPVTQNPQRPAKRGKAYSSDEEGDGPYGSRSADQGASSPRPSPPLPSRSRLLAPQRPPRPWSTPPQHPTPAPSPRLQQGPPLPDRRMHPRPQAPTTRADFAWARNPPPPPPAYTSANVTRPERDSSLLHVLANDSSRFRLCPHDPGMLTALVRDVHSTPDLAVPRTTAAKDRSAWRKWVAFCRLLGTPEWRDCHDAHGGADADGRRRECFVQAAFLLWAYRTMTPRNRNHKLPKPASARACLDAVRRVHRHNDINMCPAPSITRLVHGLLTEYVRIHGPECLIPNRREPLTNEMAAAILAIGTIREVIGPPRSPVTRTDLTRVGHRFVDWETPFWASFAALLTTLRHTGARKADLLSYDDDDFDHSSMTRANLKWRIGGSTYSSPLPIALRDLQRGDCAIIVPGCTKSDPFALHFGDKPMYLPYLPNDPTNAAARLASLEICCSVPATSRRRYPLFCADDVTRPLTHAQADNTFNSLATKALGPAVATTVSLHSGRVWLACALHANRVSPPTIQAMCRWLSPDSIRTYAHMEPAEYESYILAAIGAPITSRLAQHLPIIDADACVAHLTDSLDDLADDPLPRPRRPALSRLTNTPPPRSSDAARRSLAFDAADEDDSESECEVEASGLCDAGRLIDDENIARGAAVAVPFRLSGTEVHFAGTITRRSDRDVNGVAQYEVRFPDGETWEVRRDRLFAAVELGSRALPR